MLKVLICFVAINAAPETWADVETCTVRHTTRTVETYCAFTAGMTLANGRYRVSYCRPFDGRTKP